LKVAADGFPLAHPAWDNPAVGAELLAALPLARSELAVSALTFQWSAGLSRLVRESLAELAILHNQGCGCHGRGLCGRAETPKQRALGAALRAAAGGLEKIRRLLHPAQVVLAGPPNAGKSTLMNALTGRSVSIVHPRPGTTRDWVRELALLHGVPVWLTDTAGVWERLEELPAGHAFVDTEAARRARERAAGADVVFWLSEGGRERAPQWCPADRVIRVATKRDAVPAVAPADISVSAATGEGLDPLKQATLARLGLADFDAASPTAFTERQASLLATAADALSANNADGPAAVPLLQALLRG
jgi:tRNA U34 5-carboxymethylaminomethyl modifying GTPase MnmE/TrmE